ncbi:GNAT family N-acetyltransferase [Micromonospora sp. DT47]|uniref:GNAT family N-acetyltransferase n=1 Tax=Micromonospora sp. DT47 TaxID=3393431 RepID=UPI003CE6D6BE
MNITVARTIAEVDSIAEQWDAMSVTSPHAARALFTLVLRASRDDVRPHVLMIRDGVRPPILVVGRVERRPVPVRVGYRTVLSMTATRLVVVPGGVIGAESRSDYELVMRSLLDTLRRHKLDALELSKIELGGPLYEAALRHLPWYRRAHASSPLKRHRSDLSGGFAAFLAARSKGTRWRLRRRLRKLDEVTGGGGKLSVHRIGPGDDAATGLRMLEAVAGKSYQRGIGVGFIDDELHRALMTWATDGGAYRVWLLLVDDVPVAYVNGVLHGRTFFLFETAFDQSLAADEPGAILLTRVLEELAADPEVDGFDYGFGDAQYKQSLSDVCWDEVDMVGFALRPRPLALSLTTSSAAFAVVAAKRLLGGERVAKLRRRRRAELTAPARGRDGD